METDKELKRLNSLAKSLLPNTLKELIKVIEIIQTRQELVFPKETFPILVPYSSDVKRGLCFLYDKVLMIRSDDIEDETLRDRDEVGLILNEQLLNKLILFKKIIDAVLIDQLPTNKRVKFENNSLIILLRDGTNTSIDFETQRESEHMLKVFKVLYEYWQGYGEKPLEVEEIRRRLINKKIPSDTLDNQYFLTSQISNIRKKVRGKGLENTIIIEYIKPSKGYSFVVNLG